MKTIPLLIFLLVFQLSQANSLLQNRIEEIHSEEKTNSSISKNGILPISLVATTKNNKKLRDNPYQSYSKFHVYGEHIQMKGQDILLDLPFAYLHGGKATFEAGWKNGAKRFPIEYTLPQVISISLHYPQLAKAGESIPLDVRLLLSDYSIITLSPWTTDTAWAKCFMLLADGSEIKLNSPQAPVIRPFYDRTMDLELYWIPNPAIAAEALVTVDATISMNIQFNGEDGANGGYWSGTRLHGNHGHHGQNLSVYLDQCADTSLIQVSILNGNSRQEVFYLEKGKGSLHLETRGGNGGNGGDGAIGTMAPEGSLQQGQRGEDGGNGGDGGDGGFVDIYYTPELEEYLFQITVDNSGGAGGKGGYGGKGGLNDTQDESLADVLFPSRGEHGNAGIYGKNGRNGRVEYRIK